MTLTSRHTRQRAQERVQRHRARVQRGQRCKPTIERARCCRRPQSAVIVAVTLQHHGRRIITPVGQRRGKQTGQKRDARHLIVGQQTIRAREIARIHPAPRRQLGQQRRNDRTAALHGVGDCGAARAVRVDPKPVHQEQALRVAPKREEEPVIQIPVAVAQTCGCIVKMRKNARKYGKFPKIQKKFKSSPQPYRQRELRALYRALAHSTIRTRPRHSRVRRPDARPALGRARQPQQQRARRP